MCAPVRSRRAIEALRAGLALVASQIPGIEDVVVDGENGILCDPRRPGSFAAAIGAGARILVTHNIRHFRSGEGVRVVRPRTLIEEVRGWLASLGT